MASVSNHVESSKLLNYVATPSTSPTTEKIFDRVFKTSLSTFLFKPDHIKERIDNKRYVTRLFFKDEKHTELSAMYSVDVKPFKCVGVEDGMRVHFLHTNGSTQLQKPLLLKVVAFAIEKKAKAILFFVTPQAKEVNQLLKDLDFSKFKEETTHKIMVCRDLGKLQSALKGPVAPPAPPSQPELPLPTYYKGVTLMRKYLHMIRDGYSVRGNKVYKTVEGRINRGMFAAHKITPGSGMRFFYMQNAHDDVQCTITGVKTFRTFREMLVHHGYQKLVPDAASLEAAVAAYARIPGYTQKEKESGVISMELRVDGSGPKGPAFRNTPAQQPASRKRRHDERSDYRDDRYPGSSYPKHYRSDSYGNGNDRYRSEQGRRY